MKHSIIVSAAGLLLLALTSAAHGQGMSGVRPGGGASGAAGDLNVGNGGALIDSSSVGQVDASARYTRDNRQAGQFIGAPAESGFVGQVNAEGTAGGGRSGVGSAQRRGATNVNSRGNARQQIQIRATLRLGFARPARDAATQANILARRIAKSNWIDTRRPVEVSIENGVATLRGAVANEHDRILIERLAMLEGGVRRVVNELALAEGEASTLP